MQAAALRGCEWFVSRWNVLLFIKELRSRIVLRLSEKVLFHLTAVRLVSAVETPAAGRPTGAVSFQGCMIFEKDD
jgi:hypothetical protein